MCMPEKMGTVDHRSISGASDHSERCDPDPFDPGDGNRRAPGDDGAGFTGCTADIDEYGSRIFGSSGIYAGDRRGAGDDRTADVLESKSAACDADDPDRNAAIEIIASATIAAKIGAGGLGGIILTGLGLNRTDLLLIGGISVALLSLAAGMVFRLLMKLQPAAA